MSQFAQLSLHEQTLHAENAIERSSLDSVVISDCCLRLVLQNSSYILFTLCHYPMFQDDDASIYSIYKSLHSSIM